MKKKEKIIKRYKWSKYQSNKMNRKILMVNKIKLNINLKITISILTRCIQILIHIQHKKLIQIKTQCQVTLSITNKYPILTLINKFLLIITQIMSLLFKLIKILKNNKIKDTNDKDTGENQDRLHTIVEILIYTPIITIVLDAIIAVVLMVTAVL